MDDLVLRITFGFVGNKVVLLEAEGTTQAGWRAAWLDGHTTTFSARSSPTATGRQLMSKGSEAYLVNMTQFHTRMLAG